MLRIRLMWRPTTLFIVLLLPACSRLRPPAPAIDRLKPCTTDEGPADAYCGKVEVWEDRQAKSGRKLGLKVVVLPGLRREPAPDPLFFLAGGPGQGAAKMAKRMREFFRGLRTNRDIVLVDQRGTGDSNPLTCQFVEENLDQEPQVGIDRLRACLASYTEKADVRLYTTPVAMDDLDDVRKHLGYSRINLYGGSYGTRAAIVYARRHAPHVRSVILDGVAPTDMRLPLYMARDGQRALELMLRDCEKDPACRQRFPALGERVKKLLAGFDSRPPRLRLTHPRSGADAPVTIRRHAIAGLLFAALYSPQMTSLLPLLIERAEKGDYQGFFALGAAFDGVEENMAHGMHFSVVCAEDAPGIPADAVMRETAGTFMGATIAEWRLKPCQFWPRATLESGYYESAFPEVPALILSGDLDPVTPPSWGEHVASKWKNARHVVVPGAGHGTTGSGCVMNLLRQFVNEASAAKLNPDCVKRINRPPFFLGPSGPDPQGTPAPEPGKQ
jgi:pimeloyl-ACP methyl ester carboxylesterase